MLKKLNLFKDFNKKFKIFYIPFIISYYGITLVLSYFYMLIFSQISNDIMRDGFTIIIPLIIIVIYYYFTFRHRVKIFDLYMPYRKSIVDYDKHKWILLVLLVLTTIIPTIYNIYFFKKSYYGVSEVSEVSELKNNDKYVELDNFNINKEGYYYQRVKDVKLKSYGRGTLIFRALKGNEYDIDLSVEFLFEIKSKKGMIYPPSHNIFLWIKQNEHNTRIYLDKDEYQNEENYYSKEIDNIKNYPFSEIKYVEQIDRQNISKMLLDQLPYQIKNDKSIIIYKPVFDEFDQEYQEEIVTFVKMLFAFPIVVLYALVWLKIEDEEYEKYLRGEKTTISSKIQKFWRGEYDDLKKDDK